MLFECGLGDAYGGGFEFADQMLEFNTVERYVQHPTHTKLKPGMYTDDTQMSIAIAEAVILRDKWTRESLAEKFVSVFRRDPRDGYSRGFQKILNEVKDGQELLAKIKGNSVKSGAAMRSAPCGMFDDIKEVLVKAEIQAKVTHDSIEGITSAQAAALMSWYFHKTIQPKKDVGKFLDKHVAGGSWDGGWHGKVQCSGYQCVLAAISAIKRCSSRKELLRTCVAYTGDTDTVCAIALACSAPCHEIDSTTPTELFDTMENGKFGRNYLIDLDRLLISPEKQPIKTVPWRVPSYNV